MSLFIPASGRQKPIGVKLTTTNATTIIAGSTSGIYTLESLSYSCNTSTTLSLWLTDGTTIWYIKEALTVAANTGDIIKDHHIQIHPGWSLVAQAAAANRIDLIAVVALATQTDNARR